MGVKVLLIGGGGREHAIAWKLRQSPFLTDLFIAPGNAGTAELGQNLALPIPGSASNSPERQAYIEAVLGEAKRLTVDLVFVAPDDPLAWGLVDRLEAAGIAAFGPSAAAARLESSKAQAKEFMGRNSVPHPKTASFANQDQASAFVQSAAGQLVVKADGLAVGKGVIVTSDQAEALAAVEGLMSGRLAGESGRRVVIEERLFGREVSPHAFSDGQHFAPMPLSCDHKTVFDGGEGPNTGGMGVYSPPWWADAHLTQEAFDGIVAPTIEGMKAEGTPFKGILYPNLMSTPEGLSVLEYNARFGDPEAQALLPRLDSDLLEILIACVEGRLDQVSVDWDDGASVCVVLASQGYPGKYETGLPISGLEQLDKDVRVFQAGTKRAADGELITAGGRVLSVVATGPSVAAARTKAYENAERIHFEGRHMRGDIGAMD